MSNNCIKCNREIEKSQKACLVCGASQNYFSYYFTTGIVFLVLLGGVVVAGYWYENRPGKMAELNRLKAVEVKAKDTRIEIEKSTTENISLRKQLQELELQLQTVIENASLNNQSELEKDQLINKNKAKAAKAEKRASWLSKQNINFKAEITALKSQVSALQAAPDPIVDSPIKSATFISNEPKTIPDNSEQEQPVELTSGNDKN